MIRLYTDGACSGNPGHGGYAAILFREGPIRPEIYKRGFVLTTNNRMELLAVIRGLSECVEGESVTVYSDSKYIVDAVTQGWIDNWGRNGWRTSKRKPVKNKDLWLKIIAQSARVNVTWVWVKGHADNNGNILADQHARDAITGELDDDEGYLKENPRISSKW